MRFAGRVQDLGEASQMSNDDRNAIPWKASNHHTGPVAPASQASKAAVKAHSWQTMITATTTTRAFSDAAISG